VSRLILKTLKHLTDHKLWTAVYTHTYKQLNCTINFTRVFSQYKHLSYRVRSRFCWDSHRHTHTHTHTLVNTRLLPKAPPTTPA